MDTFSQESKLWQLRKAILTNDLQEIKTLISDCGSRWWCRERTPPGNTILQESIASNRREIFDFILPFHDLADLEIVNKKDQTALLVAMNLDTAEDVEYFVTKLLDKGVYLHGKYSFGSLLHKGMTCCWEEITELLLRNGVDANVKDEFSNTALHKALHLHHDNFELIATLLYHGADPLLRNSEGYNAFEVAVLTNSPLVIQEALFDYLDVREIDIGVLIRLFSTGSTFILRFLGRKLKCGGVTGPNFEKLFEVIITQLFHMSPLALELLLKGVDISALISNGARLVQHRSPSFYRFLDADQIILKLDLLLQAMGSTMVNFLNVLDSSAVCTHIVTHFDDENTATELLIFLFQYGLQTAVPISIVYAKYGFNDLFRFLLCASVELCVYNPYQALVFFIRDPLLDVNTFMENTNFHPSIEGWATLLRFFADRKLRSFLLRKNYVKGIPGPRVPLLQELARNVARKYLAERFKVANVGQFVSVVNTLPISAVQREIIMLKKPLY